VIRAAVTSTVLFVALLLVGARVTDALEAADWTWAIVCAAAGLLAGFAGAWVAGRGPYVVAVAGPALLALVFALTTDSADAAGPWIALAAAVAAATAGAAAGAAQRRR
jgi:hypothetical protein